ncbi:MAG: fibronectin type III domain-containing protein, partial [Ignavibacteriales bacterium]|nr:fibronectin type III domain-containing protein [Ignavibacteriales bacterium]
MKTFVTLMALFFATIMLFTGLAQAQQVIGTFPKMDGGFEGQKADTIWRYTGFKDVQTTIWTVNTGPATVYATGGRSGPKYVNYTYTAASGGRPLQSPTCDSGAIIANTLYTIQYYYRTTSDTATAAVMTACIALNGTVDGFTRIPASGGFSLAGTSNAWVKHTDSIKIISSLLPKWGLAGVRAGGAMGITLDIDDFVVYAGGVDSVAPDAPISPTTPLISGTRIQLSWTAPSTGVDSGGYMVVRGLADPSTVPTVNGIYAVGNTIAPGEQVVYLGTSTSFTDVGLNWNTQYYYRIYTVDKAFNYSSSVSVNATTKTLPSDALTNGSFGSSTGWTALLDLGGGMQATFDYNYGTVPTDGTAPGLRVVGPVTPGDWSAQVNSTIYQALSLSAANSYLLSGVIEAVKDSNSNFWLEVWLVDVEPAAGKDITLANYPNAVNLAALKQ